MAQNIKQKTIMSIATFIGVFGGLRLYMKQKRRALELKEIEREKQWAREAVES